jgi:hypothetical protein
MSEGEPLTGDGVAQGIVRIGDTVRRPLRPFSLTVQAYLAHLRDGGFTGATLPLGVDEQGREVLSFVPGDVPRNPLPPETAGDDVLVALAQPIRADPGPGMSSIGGGYASYNGQGLARGDSRGSEETAVSRMRLPRSARHCAPDLSRRYRQCLLWTEQAREPFAGIQSCRGDAVLVVRHRSCRGTFHHACSPPSSSTPPPSPPLRTIPNDRSLSASWLPPPF